MPRLGESAGGSGHDVRIRLLSFFCFGALDSVEEQQTNENCHHRPCTEAEPEHLWVPECLEE